MLRGNLYVVCSFVFLVPCLLAAGAAIFFRYKFLPAFLGSKVLLGCTLAPMHHEIYQHGDYWVVSNFIRPPGNAYSCVRGVTLTMQGIYADIYKLEQFYMNGIFQGTTSFAVYVPNEEHFNRTLAAIGYVRNCVWTKLVNKRYSFKSVPFIRDRVYFHLYFRLEQLSKHVEIRFAEHIVEQQTYCEGYQEQFVSTNSTETIEEKQHAVIVGRNIAQLATSTPLFMSLDVDTYPSVNIEYSVFYEYIKLYNDLGSSAKHIIYVPVFHVLNTERRLHLERLQKVRLHRAMENNPSHFSISETNFFKVDQWWNKESVLAFNVYNFSDYHEQFRTHMWYFIGNTDAALLDESFGLSLAQSIQLRNLKMLLQNYKFIVPWRLYLLHNTSSFITQQNKEPWIIDTNLVKQYEIMYGKI